MDHSVSPVVTTVPVIGGKPFAVRRIFCIGLNYRDHAREMGVDPDQIPPCYFTKPADAVLPNHGVMPYAPATNNLHYELELVVAIGVGGANIAAADADRHIFGYAAGLDMTRRDLQAESKGNGMPWDMAKGFDYSAPMSAITPKAQAGDISKAKVELKVNGQVRQSSDLTNLIVTIPEIVALFSKFVTLAPGDLIFTGTPSGVGPVVKGDKMEGQIDGLETLVITIG